LISQYDRTGRTNPISPGSIEFELDVLENLAVVKIEKFRGNLN